MKKIFLAIATLLAFQSAQAEIFLQLKPRPDAPIAKDSQGSTCYKGQIGRVSVSGPGGADQYHRKSAFVQIVNGKNESIGAIKFSGSAREGAFAFMSMRGQAIVICENGNFTIL